MIKEYAVNGREWTQVDIPAKSDYCVEIEDLVLVSADKVDYSKKFENIYGKNKGNSVLTLFFKAPVYTNLTIVLNTDVVVDTGDTVVIPPSGGASGNTQFSEPLKMTGNRVTLETNPNDFEVRNGVLEISQSIKNQIGQGGTGGGGGTLPSGYYTSQETDNLLKDKLDISQYNTDMQDVYKKGEVNTLLGDKVDNTTYNQDKGNYYVKGDVDAKLGDKLDVATYNQEKLGYYTKNDIDTKMSGKLDASVYNQDKKTLATKSEVNTGLSGKLDTSTYNQDKQGFATKTELADKVDKTTLAQDYYERGDVDALVADKITEATADSKYANKQDVYTKSQTDSAISSAITASGINKQDFYTKAQIDADFATKTELSRKADSSTLTQNYYDKGAIDTKLGDVYTKGDADNKFATKNELTTSLASKADTSALAGKLDASTYNQEKTNFATKNALSGVNTRIDELQNAVRPVLFLSEDTATVEGQADTQQWLTQKLLTEKGMSPSNGLVIYTSDSDGYAYFNGTWFLRKTYKVVTATNSTLGIMKGRDEKGHGYIVESGAGDGSFKLADYDDMIAEIGDKASQGDFNTLKGRVDKVEGQVANKVDNNTLTQNYYNKGSVDSKLSAKADSTTIGDLQNTGLTGTTVTELLTDAKTKIDTVNSSLPNMGDYYNKTSVNNLLDDKVNLTTYNQDKATFATKNELSGYVTGVTFRGLEQKVTSLESDVAQKLDASAISDYLKTTVADSKYATKTDLSSKADGTALTTLEGRVGGLQGTGLNGNTVTELLTDAGSRLSAIDLTQYVTKASANSTFATKSSLDLKANDADVVKLTGNQTIDGNKTFTSKLEIDANDEVLKLKNASNTANYIAGYEGNTRIYYIGKDSLNSIDLSIKNEYSVNGWITLKTKSKFDQAYTITDNNQIVHKKYVDDTINTNCVKLTGNQTIAGDKTFSGTSKFTGFVDVDAAPTSISPNNYCMLRFVGDKWSSGQTADLIRFHKYGPVCGYKIYLNGTGFNYAEIYGKTLISNMKDPTEDAHGANKKYVDDTVNAKISFIPTTGTMPAQTTSGVLYVKEV